MPRAKKPSLVAEDQHPRWRCASPHTPLAISRHKSVGWRAEQQLRAGFEVQMRQRTTHSSRQIPLAEGVQELDRDRLVWCASSQPPPVWTPVPSPPTSPPHAVKEDPEITYYRDPRAERRVLQEEEIGDGGDEWDQVVPAEDGRPLQEYAYPLPPTLWYIEFGRWLEKRPLDEHRGAADPRVVEYERPRAEMRERWYDATLRSAPSRRTFMNRLRPSLDALLRVGAFPWPMPHAAAVNLYAPRPPPAHDENEPDSEEFQDDNDRQERASHGRCLPVGAGSRPRLLNWHVAGPDSDELPPAESRSLLSEEQELACAMDERGFPRHGPFGAALQTSSPPPAFPTAAAAPAAAVDSKSSVLVVLPDHSHNSSVATNPIPTTPEIEAMAEQIDEYDIERAAADAIANGGLDDFFNVNEETEAPTEMETEEAPVAAPAASKKKAPSKSRAKPKAAQPADEYAAMLDEMVVEEEGEAAPAPEPAAAAAKPKPKPRSRAKKPAAAAPAATEGEEPAAEAPAPAKKAPPKPRSRPPPKPKAQPAATAAAEETEGEPPAAAAAPAPAPAPAKKTAGKKRPHAEMASEAEESGDVQESVTVRHDDDQDTAEAAASVPARPPPAKKQRAPPKPKAPSTATPAPAPATSGTTTAASPVVVPHRRAARDFVIKTGRLYYGKTPEEQFKLASNFFRDNFGTEDPYIIANIRRFLTVMFDWSHALPLTAAQPDAETPLKERQAKMAEACMHLFYLTDAPYTDMLTMDMNAYIRAYAARHGEDPEQYADIFTAGPGEELSLDDIDPFAASSQS